MKYIEGPWDEVTPTVSLGVLISFIVVCSLSMVSFFVIARWPYSESFWTIGVFGCAWVVAACVYYVRKTRREKKAVKKEAEEKEWRSEGATQLREDIWDILESRRQFFNECCEVSPYAVTEHFELREAYRAYCREKNISVYFDDYSRIIADISLYAACREGVKPGTFVDREGGKEYILGVGIKET